MKDYQKHVYTNIECKSNLPYSYQFCPYIGHEQNGFQKHHQCKSTYEKFKKENPVTTGQNLDFSSDQVSKNALVPNRTSYQYKRFTASGIVNIT